MGDLLAVDVAIEKILSTLERITYEQVDISHALDRIICEDIYSDMKLPPFDNSAMDGYAVRAEDVANASPDNPTILKVVMDIPAGIAPNETLTTGQAARIMTGAPLPDGADSIIPVESTNTDWSEQPDAPLTSEVKIHKSAKPGDHVRLAGENIQIGMKVIDAGTRIRAQEIGILVALGISKVTVTRQPRVAIISTGNELVGVDEELTPGKIRDVNSYTLEALLKSCFCIPIRLPVARDSLEEVRGIFDAAIEAQPDMIISSAGVSVGAADLIRTVLDEYGKVNFWRVNIRPGKPLAFGDIKGIPFFGLPGNPVSAMVTFDVLVSPALSKLSGQTDSTPVVHATLEEDIQSDGRQNYVRVTLNQTPSGFTAHTTGNQSSGALMSMVLADGLMIIPAGTQIARRGSIYPVRLLKTNITT